MAGWVSPRLGHALRRWRMPNWCWTRPDGRRFETFVELAQRAEAERERADAERERAERLAERLRALGVDPCDRVGGSRIELDRVSNQSTNETTIDRRVYHE
jgi:hypothetical protein